MPRRRWGSRPAAPLPTACSRLKTSSASACTEAPCLQVNYRYKLRLTTDDLDQLIDDIRNGRATDIPEHGTLGLVRQHIPAGAGAGIVAPEQATERPVWLARNDAAAEGGEA